MLKHLHIENVAVIEKVDIEFDKGFTVLTGETGAGKSIIIDSIELVLGERASRDMIRNNAKYAYVSVLFNNLSDRIISFLEKYSVLIEEDKSILIERELGADGKSSCKINGRQTTVSILREIGAKLINIHGQHINQQLLNSETHINYLDSFAKNENLLSTYQTIYENVVKLKSELSEFQKLDRDKENKLDFLKYQIDEIEKANLYPGEEEELKEKSIVLANAQKLNNALYESYSALYGDEINASQLIKSCISVLNPVVKYSSQIQNLCLQFDNVEFELQECVEQIRDFIDKVNLNSGQLELIEERLDLIYRLKKKYGDSVQDILEFLENAKSELGKIESFEERINTLNFELQIETEKLKTAGEELTDSRLASANLLSQRVTEELSFLDMEKVRFNVSVTKANDYMNNGIDNVEFLLTTNIGEIEKPLAKIASGGELSRIMLSIINVLADIDDVDTLIFDEVDSGISGKSAQKIGIKLKQVSKGRQIICITHLAQIASLSDNHYLIQKGEQGGRTFTEVKTLDFEGRKYELARIMGGIKITDLTLKGAEELLGISQTF